MAKMKAVKANPAAVAQPEVALIPHDWTYRNWPGSVYPYNGEAGRRVVRKHLDALLQACAVTRAGRSLIVFGREYERWLRTQTPTVKAYEIAANRPQHAHKRGGRQRTEA